MKLNYKIILILIGIICTSFSANAYDFVLDGIYYNIISSSSLEVEVTYRTMNEHERLYDNQFYYNVKYNRSYSGSIVIPDHVTYNNKTYTVSAIGEYAFGSSDSYESAHYFPGLEYYNGSSGDNYGCDITQVFIPNSVSVIKRGAFRFCTNLESVTLSEGLNYIYLQAFMDCPLKNISIPSTLLTIGTYAFTRCNLVNVDFSNSKVKKIYGCAFSSCKSLTSAIIGAQVEYLPSSCFDDCTKLLEIFMLPVNLPSSFGWPSGSNSNMEIYVPSKANYGFGKQYISFPNSTYQYTGNSHNIEWTNNLKGYTCNISESDCKTQIDAGTATQTLKATYSNGIDFTVDIPYTYTIEQAPMTLTVQDAQKAYGDANPEFKCDITGFVNGETLQSIGATPTYECDATRLSSPGEYRILASMDLNNYQISYKYGTLTVTKAPLTANVADASRIYGNENPEFTLTYSGLKNDETTVNWTSKPQFSTTATKLSNVGQYPIEVTGGVAVNYELTKVQPGTLTIEKRELTVRANDCQRSYGEDNPEFTFSYNGFVNNDTEDVFTEMPTAECTANQYSSVGQYPIIPSGGDALNYKFEYQDGELTIVPSVAGFVETKYSVTYNNMEQSAKEDYFYFQPSTTGEYKDDFAIKVWALDKDNKYTDHDIVISNGDYAGNYIPYSGPSYAGKYIYKLINKYEDPNIEANPEDAYVTVNSASPSLVWNDPSIIRVAAGQKVELNLSYLYDSYTGYDITYNNSILKVYSEEDEAGIHWYAEGIKEGYGTLTFGVYSNPNPLGFYNYKNSPKESRRIEVYDDGKQQQFTLTYCLGEIGGLTTDINQGETATIDVSGSEDWQVKEIYFNDEPASFSGASYTTPEITENSSIRVEYEYAHEIIYDYTTGVEAPKEWPYQVAFDNGHVIITGVHEGDQIMVYTVGGLLIKALPEVPAGKETVTISLEQGEVYIILINGTPLKIAY